MEMELNVPGGGKMRVKIPPNCPAGSEFPVNYQAPPITKLQFLVAVPPGGASGMQMQVQTPDGQPMRVTIPEGEQI